MSLCLVLIKKLLIVSCTLSQMVLSSERVVPTRFHWGDSGLMKNEWEHWLAVLGALLWNMSSDWVIGKCLTVTQDSDQDTTAASDSTNSSSWVIGLELCSRAACQCCSGPKAAMVRSYPLTAWALLRHQNQVYKYGKVFHSATAQTADRRMRFNLFPRSSKWLISSKIFYHQTLSTLFL